ATRAAWAACGERGRSVSGRVFGSPCRSSRPCPPRVPVCSRTDRPAWTRDRRYAVVTNGQDTFAQIFDARTFKEVKRLTIGQGGSNIGFSKDGKTAFIAVRGANDVAVIDIEKLALATRIKAATEPQGLIVR